MLKKYYLTTNGNILDTEKKCFLTPTGHFLRDVSEEELGYYTKKLTPIILFKNINKQ